MQISLRLWQLDSYNYGVGNWLLNINYDLKKTNRHKQLCSVHTPISRHNIDKMSFFYSTVLWGGGTVQKGVILKITLTIST